jgi:tetratricopeptide (TPR) repeat protein
MTGSGRGSVARCRLRLTRFGASLGFCLVAFAFPMNVFAQSTDATTVETPLDDPLDGLFGDVSPEAARRSVELATEARAAYANDEVARAIRLFEEAFDLSRDPGFAFNLGALYESVGEIPRARAYFDAYLTLYPEAPNAADVVATLERLDAVLALEWAHVEVGSEPEGARVFVVRDGNEYFLGTTPVERWLQPGELALRFRERGFMDRDLQATISAGGETALTGYLEPRTLRAERVAYHCATHPDDRRCTR